MEGLEVGPQPHIDRLGVWRVKDGVVVVCERTATGFYPTVWAIPNGLEFPHCTDAFEISYMVSIGPVHAVDVAVDSLKLQPHVRSRVVPRGQQ